MEEDTFICAKCGEERPISHRVDVANGEQICETCHASGEQHADLEDEEDRRREERQEISNRKVRDAGDSAEANEVDTTDDGGGAVDSEWSDEDEMSESDVEAEEKTAVRFWNPDPEIGLRDVAGTATSADSGDDATKRDNPIDKRIDNWKEQLLDLTRRNTLIDFTETKTKSLPLLEESPPKVAEFLRNGDIHIHKQPSEDTDTTPHLADGEVLSSRDPQATTESLYRIGLHEKQYLRERGVDTLYIALGTLTWYAPDEPNDPYTSPLFLAPVDIEQQPVAGGDLHNYVIQPEGNEMLLNPALRKKVSAEFRLEFPPDTAFGLECIDAAFEAIHEDTKGFDEWIIEDQVILGIFDFAKYGLYTDLEENRAAVRDDPLVNALSDDPTALQEAEGDIETVRPEELDAVVDPEDVYQVLDADSSQQAAIEAAKRGRSFVIQGPPGTGKSQTIANIIAEKLAANETVLFVSEKQAALNVVKNRLDEVGLGRFCLEAHGRKAAKATVLDSLETELQTNPVKDISNRAERLAELETRRNTLNNYGDVLLSPPDRYATTPFEAFGFVAKHRSAPDIPINKEDLLNRTQEDLDTAVNRLEELSYFQTEIKTYNTHPWRHTTISQWRVDTAGQVENILTDHREAIDQLSDIAEDGEELLDVHVRGCATYHDFVSLLDHLTDRPPVEWKDQHFAPEFIELGDRLTEFARHMGQINELEETLQERYHQSFFDADGQQLHGEISQFGVFRFLRPSYYSVKNRVLSHAQDSYSPSFTQLTEDTRRLMELQRLTTEIASYEDVQTALGPLYQEEATDWDELLTVHDWVTTLEDYPFDCSTIHQLLVAGNFPDLHDLRTAAYDALETFEETDDAFRDIMVVDNIHIDDVPLYETPFADTRSHLDSLAQRVDELEAWVEFTDHLADLEETMAEDYIHEFLNAEYDPDHLLPAFKKRFFTKWLNEYYDQSALGEFHADTFGKYLDDFRRLDQEQQELAKVAVQHLVTDRRPQLNLEHADSSEQVILRREIQKQRQQKPLRELFDEAGSFVTKLKPCFMMSPLSVAQYLKKDSIQFDTVIFDEASQVMPEDAISSIIRAEQVIIAGDTKQLPPTTFFDTKIDPGRGVREDLDSILEEAAAVLPEVNLTWHYRSRSSDLIEFSNHLYYNGRLQTFPENDHETDTGLEFVYVEDGVYDRGGTRQNEVEAARVVDLVAEHAAEQPEKSLGVVAFSVAQEEAIREALEARRASDDTLDRFVDEDDILGEFFIKNLEMVQGDERDRMLFSVGYGPDENGQMSMNFGPLNQQGGERRLNVAITRAREQVTVVSSMLPDDIDLSRTSATGVEHFKRYLEYARGHAGQSDTEVDAAEASSQHPFKESVYDALTARGYEIETVTGSGYSLDFAIRDEEADRYELGIEIDASAYEAAATARDRDRIRPSVLEDLGWDIYRIWAPDWVTNPERVLKEIEKRCSSAGDRGVGEEGDSSRPDSSDPIDVETYEPEEYSREELDGRRTDVATFRDPEQDTRDVSFEKASPETIRQALLSVVLEHGPIHRDEAFRVIAAEFGEPRRTPTVEETLDTYLLSLKRNDELYLDDGFIWPQRHDLSFAVRQNTDTAQRSIDLIPSQEIALAVVLILDAGFSMTREDLIIETARLFGYDRVGNRIREHVADAIAQLEEWGHVKTAEQITLETPPQQVREDLLQDVYSKF